MGDKLRDAAQKQPQPPVPPQQKQLPVSFPPKDPVLVEATETRSHHHQPSPPVLPTGGPSPFISAAPDLYAPSGAVSSLFEQQFEVVNPKKARCTGQWKQLVPFPNSHHQEQTQLAILSTESSPSPTKLAINPRSREPGITAASSSDTALSPSRSPLRSLYAASGQDTNKSEGEQVHHQTRKGKIVSPVWKPDEMLWLARAWRIQYQGGHLGTESDGSGSSSRVEYLESGQTRVKTRADKDGEVADFLQRHGVNRDAKTAATKWDNMLGEFRKVYEWERGSEREVGKSYFRLSPYERKLHRLPASFDEEVFDELSQFMGSRTRTSQSSRGLSSGIVGMDDTRKALAGAKALPPPPSFKEDELPLSARAKQLVMTGGSEPAFHGTRGTLLGFDSSLDFIGASSSKELRRIGKIRMAWEESVYLWAEEGEHHRGRVRLPGSSFLKADELTFFDEDMVPSTMETFEDGPLRGFSVDRFVTGQQVKVFGRRKSSFATASFGLTERVFQLPFNDSHARSTPSWELQDPSEYYLGCLRVPPPTLPSLFELSWHLQEPPAEDLRFPLRRDVYRDLPQEKELFFTTSTDMLDCRAITYDILGPIIRHNPSISGTTATCRDAFIGLWDDCINRIVSKFCSVEMVIIRKPSSSSEEMLQDQWPNVTGFVRNFCLWRGEEADQLRDGALVPSSSIAEKVLWTYTDLPYILGYYAVGYLVTFCALSRGCDRIIRTDLCSLDLSSPVERLKALVPCYRIAGLLPLLADRCFSSFKNGGTLKLFAYNDFERVDMGNGIVIETTPNTVTRFFSSKRKWAAVKEIYDFLDHRIPHAESIFQSSERDLALVFKPRGCKFKPTNSDLLVEALKYVTKALVALHDLSFMHRDLGWDKVMRRNDRENEWFVCGLEEAVSAPQIYPHRMPGEAARIRHAPEMGRGLHGVKVDVWGVGYLMKTCGLAGVPKMVRELQNRCLDPNPGHRPTAADCYHHLLQLQSSLSAGSY
ncbi:hypothetical protein I3842_04G065200 [Carya illinoinensis]|uniref:Protein kinase domain-containing protein n=1 Tax=Carya illinoinensis TaxID=32201 RepID=A0A922F5V9_CARIL|nr:hypothetical protein I3842_04G065200 [Carya illinoinensis]